MSKATSITWEVVPDEDALAERAATRIRELLAQAAPPGPLLCLPTGETPKKTYARLVGDARTAAPGTGLHAARLLQLDEWGGLPPGDEATCREFLLRHLVRPAGLPAERLVDFHSQPADPAAECARIAAWLERSGPIDLCLLGLGLNGHLGLNEPGPALQPRAHVAALADSTRGHTMLRGRDPSALYGLTLGLAEILESRQILLLVSGAAKRPALRALREGVITTQLPASLLHLHAHRRVTVLCDAAAWSPG
ncbi:MAG: 6-phosphogluconolactonase [Polyangia bacterium]